MVARRGTSFEDRVGRVLIDSEFITQDQLDQAGQASEEQGKGLLDTLVDLGMVARETLMTVLSFQLRIPVVDLKTVEVDPEAVQLVPEEFAREHNILPVGFEGDGSLRIATMAPNDFQVSTQLSSITGRQTKFTLALSGALDELIERTYSSSPLQGPAGPAPSPRGEPGTAVATAPAEAPSRDGGLLGQDVAQLPAIQAVEMVTLQAVKRKASDVHIVPTSDSANVLFRLDGTLQHTVVLPLKLHESMVARIKVLAEMDISETRRPQDGSFSLQFGEKNVDFRVATIGTTWGEMMVFRILDRSAGVLSLEDLGLDDSPLAVWRQLLRLPYGMLLVSGPTGSGKTTTLYASILELAKDRGRNIMTVEDPVEYRMEQLQQIEVNRGAGIDFATGLKAIMRLDPDVILVGEIRDLETAKTAVDAALTGHLVLASIHSNDAASSFVRLLDLGLEPYMVATAVGGALAQRLVRVVCPHCKQPVELGAGEQMAFENEMQSSDGQFVEGPGCNFCGHTGFIGRTGVYEVISVTEATRKLVSSGASGQEIRQQAISDGMVPLRRAGMIKAGKGTTTITEVMSKVFFID